MKQLITSRILDIPEGVTVEVKARKVRVKGPRGEYTSEDNPVVLICRCRRWRLSFM